MRIASRILIPVVLLAYTGEATAIAASAAQAVTPVQKVLELLGALLSKGKTEKQEEEVRFTSFQQWCESTGAEKTRTIEAAAQSVQQLSADIEKADSDAAQLGEEIANLDASINGWELEQANATDMRKAEHAEFSASHQDYSESLDAIAKAIVVLKARSKDLPQASLIQARAVVTAASRLLPDEERRAMMLMAAATHAGAAGAPEANAYEFQSSSVVQLLEKLQQRFTEEKRKLETEETNRKHAMELVMEQLSNNIHHAKDARAEKSAMKARMMQDSAEGRADLGETQRAKEADEAYLSEMRSGCAQKSKDYESRQVLRAAELEALQKAIDIISSESVSGAADTHLPGALLQFHGNGHTSGTAFAQLRRASDSIVQPGAQQRAASFLSSRAQRAGSRLLATVAGRLGEDAFAKVKTMIKELLARLIEEANSEADHKGWCDAELSTNAQTREQKSAEVSDLAAQVDQLTSLEAKLSQEITQLNDEVAEIMGAVAEATKARADEKAKNSATVKDAKEAQTAVLQAIKVLKEFYGQAASATALTQQPTEEDAPFVFDGAYKGMQSDSTGVVGMLEVIQSDFARLEADTTSSEDEAVREFESFSTASAKDKETKETEARHKGFEKVRATRALGQAKEDLKATQEEMDAALNYYDKLKPSCIGETASYEDRVAMRKEEIESLKEALRILDGEELSAGV